MDDVETYSRHELEQKLRDLRHAFSELRRENNELQASFDLRWKADMRAIKRWQKEHPGKDLVWTDPADLCTWLLKKLAEKYTKQGNVCGFCGVKLPKSLGKRS